MLSRTGATLAEVIVGMTMLGIIGAAASGAVAQQGRVRMRITGRAAAEVQLREALAPLVADIGSASPVGGDFRSGQARDTAVELRATIGTAYVCATAPSPSRDAYVSVLAMERGRTVTTGDTAWSYERRAWRAAGIAEVDRSPALMGCTGERILRISSSADSSPAVGALLRFTRRARYNLYRASDGRTYLGLREWTASTGTLSGLQPVAGPFDRTRSRFRYFDTLGVELASGTVAGTELGSVLVELQARGLPGAGSAGEAAPVTSIVIGLRNRE